MNETRTNPVVVLADEDPRMLETMEGHVSAWGYDVHCVRDLVQLTERLASTTADLVLMDLHFDEMHGKALSTMLEHSNCPPVVLLTALSAAGSGGERNQTQANSAAKPLDLSHLKRVAAHAIRQRRRRRREDKTPADAARGAKAMAQRILGASAPINSLRDLIADVAVTDAKVLILGESGTGKELVARAIHDQSRRAEHAFAPVNMAALPPTLAESVLFGHEKGAFTGADSLQRGWCEMADKGTLFLDEIGEMDLAMQAKLLRFLQDGTFQRVGSSKVQAVDVRIIAATNRDPLTMVRDGRLREDLYYRLNVLPIVVPPLRDRRGDIEMLCNAFVERAARAHRKPVRGFTPAAMEIVIGHDWPGNVRELENTVERLVILARGIEIGVENLPVSMVGGVPVAAAYPIASAIPAEPPPVSFEMRDIEKEAIIKALVQTSGNVVRAAGVLGLGQATVYRKMKRYGIRVDRKQRMVHDDRTPTITVEDEDYAVDSNPSATETLATCLSPGCEKDPSASPSRSSAID